MYSNMSCRFSRWRISAILDFRGPIMGSSNNLCTTSYRSSIDTIAVDCLVFEKIPFLHFGVKIQDSGSPPSCFKGSNKIGSLKSPCTTSYKSLIETMTLNCLVFEKITFLYFGDRQTDRRTDGQARCMKPLSLSRAAA